MVSPKKGGFESLGPKNETTDFPEKKTQLNGRLGDFRGKYGQGASRLGGNR